MLRIVENESSVRRYQRQFARALKAATNETIPVKLGHPGASEKATVAWSERLGIWFFSRKIAGSRYWNAFGIGRPADGDVIAITCEINFPLCGIDRRTGGAFAEDHRGRICVVHRGRLGGGRRGIGKTLFNDRYRGVWEVIDDGGEETPAAVIGVLQSPRFARQIAQFVRKIALLKEEAVARSTQAELTFDDLRLREDLLGASYSGHEPETGSNCDHGLIVRDLAEELKGSGLRAGNDGRRDLLAVDRRGRIRALFEVVTEASLPALQAGAARLLLNAPDAPVNPLLALALPVAPDNALLEKLKRLNIEPLIYQWAGERAVFPGLGSLLPRLTNCDLRTT